MLKVKMKAWQDSEKEETGADIADMVHLKTIKD